MTSPSTKSTTARVDGTSKSRKKPHNVPRRDYLSFPDMVRKIADEPRKAQIGDNEVVMSRAEGVYRCMVDRALRGNKRELVSLLRMSIRRPSMAATFREYNITIIGGALANV